MVDLRLSEAGGLFIVIYHYISDQSGRILNGVKYSFCIKIFEALFITA